MITPTRTKTKKKKRRKAFTRSQLKFPQVKGKTLEKVDFSTDIDDHSVTLVFQDQTELRIGIEPGFTVFADYADWTTGNMKPIKRWRPIRSRLFRV